MWNSLPQTLGSCPCVWVREAACRSGLSMCGLVVLSLFLTCLEIVCCKVGPSRRFSEERRARTRGPLVPPLRSPTLNMCEPLNTKMRVDVNRHTQTQSGPFPLDLRGPRRYNCSGYIWRGAGGWVGGVSRCRLPSARRSSSSN